MVGMMDSKGKGLWADVVRRTDPSSHMAVESLQDGIKDKLSLHLSDESLKVESLPSKNGVDSSSASTPIPSFDNDSGSDHLSDANGTQEPDSTVLEADSYSESALEVSPKPVKTAWKRPVKPSIDTSEGPVMGAESWPSLADSRTMKNVPLVRSTPAHSSSDVNPEKEVASTTFSVQQKTEGIMGPGNNHLGHRKTGAMEDTAYVANSMPVIPGLRPVISNAVAANASEQTPPATKVNSGSGSNNAGRGRMPSQRGNYGNFPDNAWAPHPRNRKGGYSGRGGMPYQPHSSAEIGSGPGGMHNQSGMNGFYPRPFRAPRQRGGYGFNHANRRSYNDQGRGPNNWQPQPMFANGPSSIPPFQQPFFDPRSSTWGVPNVFPPGVGFYNHQGPEGMYYPPLGFTAFPPVTAYYDQSGALQMLPPFAQSTTVEHLLAKQIEYYFSDENLLKDAFLRSKMDAEGFVPASLIASFNKIRMLNADTNMILNALRSSNLVEVQGEKLRRRNNGPMWPLPPNHRSASSSPDSGSSSLMANDAYSVESSGNNELSQTNGWNADDITQEISSDANLKIDHLIQQSAAPILDRVESMNTVPSPSTVELDGGQCAYENNGLPLHPNSDTVDMKME